MFQDGLDGAAWYDPLQSTDTLGTGLLRQPGNVLVEIEHHSLLAKWEVVTSPSWQEALFSAAQVERSWG
jgi:hypothetical protein